MPSKLTLHLSGWDGTIPERLAQVGGRYLMLEGLDSEMYAQECQRWGIQPIYRPRIPGDPTFREMSPDQLVALMRDSGTLDKMRGKVIWLGVKEPSVDTVDDVKELNRWYWRFQELLAPDAVAAFSFPEGNPPEHLIEFVDPGPCPKISIHQYHRCRRYHRKIWQLLKPSARRNILVTETGFDLGGDPDLHGAKGNISDDEYMDVLEQEDAEFCEDDYVECAAVFQFFGPGWGAFESSRMLRRILLYMASRW